ncbi:MAG: rhomboid family intramembrane serine protease [Sediminibacterium sp.]|jgi:membrane associated rhomboid family serine protease|uniref:rhomboid family intramembrane serine protease n=1 Tax=Sediminibacterium sp. TaxID=1917865 RepID=UPI002AB9260C|nr:rhomboid family intramembrane serine protease [Sediminibacterium sp.]MDZ4071686.1 rhomboid family intramembrane serine protease [Sediminibacterium sp.]
MFSITIVILILTCIVSFTAFSNQKVIDDLIFYPPAITQRNQWYRFITNGVIHADIPHLAFNMFSFYLFGNFVEKDFMYLFNENGKILFLAMYITALAVCLIPTYFQHKDNYHYRSLGASGAVSAVVFAGIFLNPTIKIGLIIIPPIIPGFIFGPLYLILSAYMAKRGGDHINHSAHFWGAVWGIVFVIITCLLLTEFNPITNFLAQVRDYFS